MDDKKLKKLTAKKVEVTITNEHTYIEHKENLLNKKAKLLEEITYINMCLDEMKKL